MQIAGIGQVSMIDPEFRIAKKMVDPLRRKYGRTPYDAVNLVTFFQQQLR
jgi:hypothetical protein